MRKTFNLGCLAAACLSAATAATAAADSADDEVAEVRNRIESYVSAFNAHDAQALAEHWTPKAEYIHPVNGGRLQGREAIEKAFSQLFEDESALKLRVSIGSIRQVDDNVAIEDGVASVVSPDGPLEQAAYTVVHVKKDDQWFRASVREFEIPGQPEGSKALQRLAWMVGDWTGDGDDSSLKIRCQWTGGGAFLSRSFVDGQVGGTQIIGWDPTNGGIRSWTFDSEGGFSEGIWSWQKDRWVIKATAIMPDGSNGSEQRILVPAGKDRFSWRSVQRQVSGQIMPATEEVVVERVGKS